jgi:hypothetical protein
MEGVSWEWITGGESAECRREAVFPPLLGPESDGRSGEIMESRRDECSPREWWKGGSRWTGTAGSERTTIGHVYV